MNRKQIIKIIIFNLVIVAVNIISFSKAFLGMSVTSMNTMAAALSVTVIGMSVVIFVYGNYRMVSSLFCQSPYVLDELDQPREYVEALELNRDKRAFASDIDTVEAQIDSLLRKKQSLDVVLFQKFQEDTREFDNLKQVVEDTGELLFENIKKILSRMAIFDQGEYEKLKTENVRSETLYAKNQIYREHMLYVKKYIEKNEEILIQFDNLLIEVSKMGDSDEEEADGLEKLADTVAAMKNLRSAESGLKDLEKKYDN